MKPVSRKPCVFGPILLCAVASLTAPAPAGVAGRHRVSHAPPIRGRQAGWVVSLDRSRQQHGKDHRKHQPAHLGGSAGGVCEADVQKYCAGLGHWWQRGRTSLAFTTLLIKMSGARHVKRRQPAEEMTQERLAVQAWQHSCTSWQQHWKSVACTRLKARPSAAQKLPSAALVMGEVASSAEYAGWKTRALHNRRRLQPHRWHSGVG